MPAQYSPFPYMSNKTPDPIMDPSILLKQTSFPAKAVFSLPTHTEVGSPRPVGDDFTKNVPMFRHKCFEPLVNSSESLKNSVLSKQVRSEADELAKQLAVAVQEGMIKRTLEKLEGYVKGAKLTERNLANYITWTSVGSHVSKGNKTVLSLSARDVRDCIFLAEVIEIYIERNDSSLVIQGQTGDALNKVQEMAGVYIGRDKPTKNDYWTDFVPPMGTEEANEALRQIGACKPMVTRILPKSVDCTKSLAETMQPYLTAGVSLPKNAMYFVSPLPHTTVIKNSSITTADRDSTTAVQTDNEYVKLLPLVHRLELVIEIPLSAYSPELKSNDEIAKLVDGIE